MTRRRPDKGWLREHTRDPFVKRAQKEGFRTRAVYKLEEIDSRYRILHPGQTVVDLGAAPGGWSQYARQQVGARGRVLALDVLAMTPPSGVEFVHGDIADRAVLDLILERLAGCPVDLVISDMAPNISGERVSDQARSIELAARALEFAAAVLTPGGRLLLKIFQGEGLAGVREAMRRHFERVVICKPQASRPRSREVYLLGNGFQDSLGSRRQNQRLSHGNGRSKMERS
jgi:23S rRNA (uridine2552-2'-O)-methyltransferase